MGKSAADDYPLRGVEDVRVTGGPDRAIDEGNNEALHSVVVGIVDIAKTSPLTGMGDLSQVRAALEDNEQVGIFEVRSRWHRRTEPSPDDACWT